MSYKVKLTAFEGPFDLLVYLIENAKMSIYDIRISEITEQYIAYVKELEHMDFNVASEFMVLAATLLDIKSRMMLPRNEEAVGQSVEDPRSELVERILEYKYFKECAQRLQESEREAALMYEKPREDISEFLENPDELLNLDIKKFAQAFELFLSKKRREEEVRAHYVRVERDKASMESRIEYIRVKLKDALMHGISKVNMKELIPDRNDRYDIVVTFTSVLQMMRARIITAKQEHLYGDIILDTDVRAGEEIEEEYLDEEQ